MSIKMEIEMVPIEEIVQYQKNPKLHPKEQVDKIAKSIKEFGFRIPILLKSHDKKEIVSGHGRYLASVSLDLKAVPCLFADDLSEDQVKALRIIDNKVAESSYDNKLLFEELKDLEDKFLGIIDLNREDIAKLDFEKDKLYDMDKSSPLFEYRLFFQDEPTFEKFIDLSVRAKQSYKSSLSSVILKILEDNFGKEELPDY